MRLEFFSHHEACRLPIKVLNFGMLEVNEVCEMQKKKKKFKKNLQIVLKGCVWVVSGLDLILEDYIYFGT